MTHTFNLKRAAAFIITFVFVCTVFAGIVIWNNNTGNVFAEDESSVITLQINNPQMTVDGTAKNVDEEGTTPVIRNDRTLVPIRAIIEAAGGNVEWDGDTKTATITYNTDEIRLVIDSTTAYLNNAAQTLDVAPAIINDRTMLPIRFIAESFKFTVGWEQETQTITVTVPKTDVSHITTDQNAPIVYMTTEITPEALVEIYDKLGFNAEGNVAVKMSTGEPPNSNYLRPEIIKDLIQKVDGTIFECNTSYLGSRS